MKKIYGTREEARSDIFDYIEIFYNNKRRHGSSDEMSPIEYENQYYQRLGSVWIIRGDSVSVPILISCCKIKFLAMTLIYSLSCRLLMLPR